MTDTELAAAMLRKCADLALFLSRQALERYPLDWLWTGDDVASQTGMIFSPELWRRLVKPELARVFAAAKEAGVPVAYHCCGSLRPIIPDLIEIGLNVLNPVQSLCPGMEPASLKKEYGSEIAFMGGVDTQILLPTGSAIRVRRETESLIDAMTGDGGGYILAATHTIPPETPFANIFALFEASGITKEEILDRAADERGRAWDKQKVP